jgi:hypothetical protein
MNSAWLREAAFRMNLAQAKQIVAALQRFDGLRGCNLPLPVTLLVGPSVAKLLARNATD